MINYQDLKEEKKSTFFFKSTIYKERTIHKEKYIETSVDLVTKRKMKRKWRTFLLQRFKAFMVPHFVLKVNVCNSVF